MGTKVEAARDKKREQDGDTHGQIEDRVRKKEREKDSGLYPTTQALSRYLTYPTFTYHTLPYPLPNLSSYPLTSWVDSPYRIPIPSHPTKRPSTPKNFVDTILPHGFCCVTLKPQCCLIQATETKPIRILLTPDGEHDGDHDEDDFLC